MTDFQRWALAVAWLALYPLANSISFTLFTWRHQLIGTPTAKIEKAMGLAAVFEFLTWIAVFAAILRA